MREAVYFMSTRLSFRLGLLLIVPFAQRALGAQPLSKAHRILLERGIQLQGMVSRDDAFHLETYRAAGFTSVAWIWTSNPAWLGPAPGFPWSRWIGKEAEMPFDATEAPYAPSLLSLQ